MAMPRSVKKQLVIEEMTAFLEVPEAEKIVIDFYERMRKYGCQVISILRKYTRFWKRIRAPPRRSSAIRWHRCYCAMWTGAIWTV